MYIQQTYYAFETFCQYPETFEDTKNVNRSRKSRRYIQYIGQKKKTKRTPQNLLIIFYSCKLIDTLRSIEKSLKIPKG